MMQSKVSIVMPCYNKSPYIGMMLDSIINQTWDNIELIIIDDGSTDGTKNVIERYSSKIKRRGYELKLFFKKNNCGVALTLLDGLKEATGKYICTVDSDDCLDSGYVYLMADYLDKHPDINRVICDHSGSQWRIAQSRGVSKNYIEYADIFPYPIYESQLLFRVAPTCCTNMIRLKHLLENGLENYSTICRTSQEPGFNAVINFKQEEIAYIPRVLYEYCYRDNSSITSYRGSAERLEKHYNDYIDAVEDSIKHFNLPIEYKRRLSGCAQLGMCWHINAVKSRTEDSKAVARKNHERAIAVANEYFSNLMIAKIEQIEQVGFRIFHRTLSNRIIGYNSVKVEELKFNRIIAYGHGRIGQKLLPLLLQTELIPHVIWDKSASGKYSYENIPIHTPNMQELRDDDLVLLLISDLKIAEEVYDMFDGDNRKNILPYYDLLDYLGDFYFK